MAVSVSFCRARYTASGIVWVVPGRLPANVIVAPNSPSARAHARALPAASEGAIERQGDPAEHRHRRGAEGRAPRPRSADRVARMPGLDGDDEERHGDEGLGEHRSGGRERQRDAEEAVEPLPG